MKNNSDHATKKILFLDKDCKMKQQIEEHNLVMCDL